jgi:hypothetical protein
MSTVLAIGHAHPQRPAIVRAALSALCKTWTAYTLERAIADVAATSEQDYREFGLDKVQMLAALRQLRGEIGGDAMPRRLAISVARQTSTRKAAPTSRGR